MIAEMFDEHPSLERTFSLQQLKQSSLFEKHFPVEQMFPAETGCGDSIDLREKRKSYRIPFIHAFSVLGNILGRVRKDFCSARGYPEGGAAATVLPGRGHSQC